MAKESSVVSANQISLFTSREVPDAFRKAVEILHNKPKAPLTLIQRKLFNALVKHGIEKQPDERGWWSINLTSLEKDIGYSSKNREHIKESARELMKIVFEWDVMAPETKRGAWKASVLFPDVELHPEQLKFQVSSHLRALMLKPDIYAMIDMSIVRRFRRASSLAIWEFCVRYEKIGRTAEIEWTNFRTMILGESADAKAYQEYKVFKSKILKPSIAEINTEAQFTVVLRETRIGRRIDTVRFDIKRKPSEDGVIETEAEDLDVLGDLIRMGILQSEAKKLLKLYLTDRVRAAVTYTKRRIADKRAVPLDNVAAYLRHALQNGYGETAEKKEPKLVGTSNPVKMDIREQYILSQMKLAEAYFSELDHADQGILIERYNALQSTPATKLGKKVTKSSEMAFKRWLAVNLWGEPTTEQLLEFAQGMLGRAS